MAKKPRYRINFDEVKEIVVKPHDPKNSAPFRARIIHGAQAGLMLADRGPGYHTKPHIHDAEQWNYILEGEMWFFVENNGWRCRKGDVMRIPKNRMHWAWNRGKTNAIILECHTPRLSADHQNDELIAMALGDDEDTNQFPVMTNTFTPFNQADIDEIERRAFEEESEKV
jgi:quercetin dioxygenase-like cupin family protein